MSDEFTFAVRLDNDREKDIFYAGQIDGLTRYAWWKDGVQYVGSCGTTLKDALWELELERYGDKLR
jgi:hypothetical protein